MPPADAPKSRLAYIDWMRGLACVLMFQTHCYDSWLGGPARQSRFYMYSQLGGTFPAPLFLFLAGISFALVTEKLGQKGLTASKIGLTTIRRGAEIFGWAMLLRLQEYVIAWGWAPKSDLLRVDILNTIGLSMMLLGLLCWMVLWTCGAGAPVREKPEESKDVGAPSLPRSLRQGWENVRMRLVSSAAAIALLISLLTPLLWTTWRPRWLPWPLESYVNGVHNLGTPQAWLFPVFPWAGFAFAGLAVGFILQSPWTRAHEARVFVSLGAVGLVFIELSRWLDAWPHQLYPVYDYWHTSPEFFLIRVGMLMVILTASYAWCRWGPAQWGFSPIIQLGQASLLVYWVHIEFVYGRVSILAKRAQGIGGASWGLLVITAAMVLLAYVRTHIKGWMKGREPKTPLIASA
ncbi:MAG TPA: heparan-alpha-glucosaminide N-acetyltransferase domain-containing protein [Candidatus Dormibacteraeota bacterium]|nr:heparan-alpha-glucosaminide N-acetyltransferase domain-containing protein [Candidatus Dormibacteraeota bacterium]